MENKSFWLDKFKLKEYKCLENSTMTEVCIIGGGITGISTAYYLSKKGLKVILIEKDRIASKTTGHTTGKVSVQQGLFYKYLLDQYGMKYTEKYLKANKKAMKDMQDIIKKEDISCDFETKDSYVYTSNPKKYKEIQEEVEICKKLGLKVSFEKEMPLPINIQGAIKTENQAQFNPIKYLAGLCNVLEKNDVEIYENSQAIEYNKIENKYDITVNTPKGEFTILADNIVVATRYPIFNFPGMFFIKEYQELEYVLCAEVKQDINNLGIYLSTDMPAISYRTVLDGNKRYLIVAGNGSKTGKKCNGNNYQFLEDNLKNTFGEYNLLYKWTAEDCISLDKIAYIGKYSNLLKNIYVATGYKKWGMTTSNIAANIITEKILKKNSKYSAVFNSSRFKPIKNKEELGNMFKETYSSLVKEQIIKKKRKKILYTFRL